MTTPSLNAFAYRADSNDKQPKDAKELQPNTTGADGKETTALMKLKKGLFVKLYCIANDTTLVDPATDKVVKAADFTPITFTESEDGTPRFAAEGKPQESTFVGWHTRLLTAAVKADTLAPPSLWQAPAPRPSTSPRSTIRHAYRSDSA